jgi:hypothetical protein
MAFGLGDSGSGHLVDDDSRNHQPKNHLPNVSYYKGSEQEANRD